MGFIGIRDTMGPIMVGPSSSHTAGALRIAYMARDLFGTQPSKVTFTLYGSFSKTYRGHGTDRALVAGILGMHSDDLRIKDSFEIARQAGLDFEFKVDHETKTSHPNTVDIELSDGADTTMEVRGESIGGGAARLVMVDGNKTDITGEYNSVIVYQRDVPGVLGFISSTLALGGINIGSVGLHRRSKGGLAINILEVDDPLPDDVKNILLSHPQIFSVRFIEALGKNRVSENAKPEHSAEEASVLFQKFDFTDATGIVSYCDDHDMSIGDVFIKREKINNAMNNMAEKNVDTYLHRVIEVMKESVEGPLDAEVQTMGGLITGNAGKVKRYVGQPDGVFSGMFANAATYAMAVLETNASMGRIVAAPTAGSAGVVPGVLMALEEQREFTEAQMKSAIGCAAAIGFVVSRNATVAGAEGGCQAEMGTASAMAAAAATQLLGGSPQTCLDAAAIAITNMMGLVCDPVCGLVEEPCQKRNASAAVNALVSAQLALSGVHSTAPFDETVDAMKKVGRSLPIELRETALGGIAACPSCKGCALG